MWRPPQGRLLSETWLSAILKRVFAGPLATIVDCATSKLSSIKPACAAVTFNAQKTNAIGANRKSAFMLFPHVLSTLPRSRPSRENWDPCREFQSGVGLQV